MSSSPSRRVAEFLMLAPVRLACEGFVKNIVDQRGFSGAADAGDDGEGAEGKHQVNILQIVEGRPA